MAIGPLLPGRIPSSLLASRLQQNLFANDRTLATLQDQAATGQRLTLPSDDPAAAVRSIVLQSQLEHQQQYHTSIQTDQSFLNASDQSLQTVSGLLNQAKSLLLSGVGDTVSSTEKAALADEVAATIKSAATAANASTQGRYLFGGTQTSQPPFEVQADNTVLYHGDQLPINTQIDQHLVVNNTVDGAFAFGRCPPFPRRILTPAFPMEQNSKICTWGLGRSWGRCRSLCRMAGRCSKRASICLRPRPSAMFASGCSKRLREGR